MVLGNAPDYELSEKPWTPEPTYHFLMHEGKYLKPRYKVGEIVYLKEPYALLKQSEIVDVAYKYGYPNNLIDNISRWKSNVIPNIHEIKWKNKLFMPERAARYFIKITGVRAELLQDISEEDCLKEGIKIGRCGNENHWMKAFYAPGDNQPYMTARSAYEELINRINGKGTWNLNPYVWVYDFELTTSKI